MQPTSNKTIREIQTDMEEHEDVKQRCLIKASGPNRFLPQSPLHPDLTFPRNPFQQQQPKSKFWQEFNRLHCFNLYYISFYNSDQLTSRAGTVKC